MRTSEAEIQEFLEKHPHFLQGLDGCACEIRSHVNLVASNGSKQVPDFMLRLEDSDRWNILELKRPDASPFLGNRSNGVLAHTAARAIGQLLRYRDAAHTASSRRAMLERYGSFPYEPSLTVLIGRGASDRRFRWHPPPGGLPGVDLVTYDYLLERARESARLMEDLRAETNIRHDAVGSSRRAGL